MRLDDEAESQNVEDRRGGGFGGGGFPLGGKSIGIGTIVIALAASYFFGIDPMLILGGASNVQQQPAPSSQAQRAPSIMVGRVGALAASAKVRLVAAAGAWATAGTAVKRIPAMSRARI